MRIAILSNVTVEVLAGMLRKEHELWLAPGFGAWREIALDVPDDLKAFDPEAVFVLLDFALCPSPPDLLAVLSAVVASLEAALPRTTVIVPDIDDLLSPSPLFHDARMWRLAAMPWSLKGLRAIRDEINRLLGAMKGGRRKVLAIDFDNTLWQGVIGEDGAAGIVPEADFQREIRALRERGILLVGLSRNNAADVEPVWHDPRMVLKLDDFADLRVDWKDKAENLAAAASALNLGTDSFVFVDDDPVERAQMAASHPEVAVPDWPVSVRRLARLYFPRMRVTDEDRRKTELYRAEAQRKTLAASRAVEDYLKELAIRTEIHLIAEDECVRVAQLSQKANQFNVCTNRHTVDDVVRFAADPTQMLATVRVSDRFGDLGLVGFVRVTGVGAGACEITDFVLSCRAMNRRVEFSVCDWIFEALRKRGVEELRATWRRTAKNAPVRDLFEKLGFAVVRAEAEEKRYAKILV